MTETSAVWVTVNEEEEDRPFDVVVGVRHETGRSETETGVLTLHLQQFSVLTTVSERVKA